MQITVLKHFLLQSFVLTGPHCKFRGVGQSVKQPLVYLWYPLFQTQWERCDKITKLTINDIIYT
jgi:hypothetical protein